MLFKISVMKSSLEHVPLCTQFGMLWCLKNNVKKWLISIQILVATDTDSKQTLDTPTNSGELYQTLVLITMVASENSNHVGHMYFYFLEKFLIWIIYIYICNYYIVMENKDMYPHWLEFCKQFYTYLLPFCICF